MENMVSRRFVTENSVYIIEDGRYMRLPKDESYRPVNESWRLVDGEWIELDRWTIENIYGDGDRLHLWTPDAVHGVITSPIVKDGSQPLISESVSQGCAE